MRLHMVLQHLLINKLKATHRTVERPTFLVRLNVFLEAPQIGVLLPTEAAHVSLVVRVSQQMNLQVVDARELLRTCGTDKRLFPSMYPHVFFQRLRLSVTLSAFLTSIGFLSAVYPHVLFEIVIAWKSLSALVALVRPFPSMRTHVQQQPIGKCE